MHYQLVVFFFVVCFIADVFPVSSSLLLGYFFLFISVLDLSDRPAGREDRWEKLTQDLGKLKGEFG